MGSKSREFRVEVSRPARDLGFLRAVSITRSSIAPSHHVYSRDAGKRKPHSRPARVRRRQHRNRNTDAERRDAVPEARLVPAYIRRRPPGRPANRGHYSKDYSYPIVDFALRDSTEWQTSSVPVCPPGRVLGIALYEGNTMRVMVLVKASPESESGTLPSQEIL